MEEMPSRERLILLVNSLCEIQDKILSVKGMPLHGTALHARPAIHHSQKEIKATDSYTDYDVFIRPTTDFKAHLMLRGGWLQVVSPKSLAKEILEWHQEAIDRYARSM